MIIIQYYAFTTYQAFYLQNTPPGHNIHYFPFYEDELDT